MKRLLLTTCLLAAVCAHAQTACTVDVIYPSHTDSYTSAACYEGFSCYPNPQGCTSVLTIGDQLHDAVVSAVDPALAYAVYVPSGVLYVGDATLRGAYTFTGTDDGGNFVATWMVADPIFADGADQ